MTIRTDAPTPTAGETPLAAAGVVPAPPQRCCAEYGLIMRCDGETCTIHCPICQATFEQRCPDADLWNPDDESRGGPTAC